MLGYWHTRERLSALCGQESLIVKAINHMAYSTNSYISSHAQLCHAIWQPHCVPLPIKLNFIAIHRDNIFFKLRFILHVPQKMAVVASLLLIYYTVQ